jgi:hypothetical protein
MPNSNPEQDPIETRIAMQQADIEQTIVDRDRLLVEVADKGALIMQSIAELSGLLIERDQQKFKQTHPEQTTNTA